MTSIEPISQALERFEKIDQDCDRVCAQLTSEFLSRMGLSSSPLDAFLIAKLREFMLYLHFEIIQQNQMQSNTISPSAKLLSKEIFKICSLDNPENHPFDYFRGKDSMVCFEPSRHRWSLEASFANSLALKLCKNPDREAVLQFLPLAYQCRSMVRTFCESHPEFYE